MKKFILLAFTKIKGKWVKICIKDRVIIIIMALLLIQSVINLFINEINSVEAINIDVIFRTTTAAIFGYILSANFLKPNDKVYPLDTQEGIQQLYEKDGRIGEDEIAATMTEESLQITLQDQPIQNNKEQEPAIKNHTELQILIAGVICIGSLIVLMIVRDFTSYDGDHSATIVQFRDFISGCVGFLIGHSSATSKKK